MKKFCVYKTTHPDGRWYIGRSITKRVLKEGYQGSGVKIKHALAAYPGEFTTVILHDNLTTEEADEIEAALVTKEIIDTDPKCLNIQPGGKAPGWAGNPDVALTTAQRISKTRKEKMKNDPEFKAKVVACAKLANQAPRKPRIFTLVLETEDKTFASAKELKAWAHDNYLQVENVGNCRYIVVGDLYFHCEGVKFKTLQEIQAIAKEKRAKVIKIATRQYALLSRILQVCDECGYKVRGKREMTSHWRKEHKGADYDIKVFTHMGCKEKVWKKR